MNISTDLRQIALIIILTPAGLNLDIKDLRKVGRPAILLCFVPACFEIVGMVIFAPLLLGITRLEAAIMGAVIAAVSLAAKVRGILQRLVSVYTNIRGGKRQPCPVPTKRQTNPTPD